jgi:hypothetical protein
MESLYPRLLSAASHRASAIARILCRGPGQARLLDLLPPAPNRGRAGRQGSKGTHGPRRLATSRLVEVLVPRLALWFERSARRAASPPNPGRPARGVFRFAPHRPRWSSRSSLRGFHRVKAQALGGAPVTKAFRLPAITSLWRATGTPGQARLGPPGLTPHLRCKGHVPATAPRLWRR